LWWSFAPESVNFGSRAPSELGTEFFTQNKYPLKFNALIDYPEKNKNK
jgi:hypothetical protein